MRSISQTSLQDSCAQLETGGGTGGTPSSSSSRGGFRGVRPCWEQGLPRCLRSALEPELARAASEQMVVTAL